MSQDDLTPFEDTPLVRALTGPGRAEELAGQDAALTAFRTSASSRRRRGMVRFLGTGATSLALLGVAGGGVAAAAFTRSLPTPVQSFAHDVFGPIGVPAPAPHKPHKRYSGTLATGPAEASSAPGGASLASASATPTPQPAAEHSAAPNGTAKPPVVEPTPSLSVSAAASAGASASASASPSPTAPAGDPSTWMMSASASSRVVPVHGSVQITGTLVDADGRPIADHKVVVRTHVPETAGWQRGEVLRTDSTGSVQTSLSDLTENHVVVLGAGNGVHSAPLRIIVRPELSVQIAPSADGTSYVVTVSADGGDPGDMLTLFKRTGGGWTQIGQAQLDDSSSASFSVPAPAHRQAFDVGLAATRQHGPASQRFVLRSTS